MKHLKPLNKKGSRPFSVSMRNEKRSPLSASDARRLK
jgi:hypothetical protein